MDDLPRIQIDWNNAYGDSYVLYLPCSTKDIEEQGIILREGLRVRIYGDVHEADAIITWYDNKFWLARQIRGTFVDVEESLMSRLRLKPASRKMSAQLDSAVD